MDHLSTLSKLDSRPVYGANLYSLLPDLKALIGFGIFWLTAGYLLFNWMERRARQTGAIG